MRDFTPERLLVLAPHTDDAEIGAGGLIARLCEGGVSVRYVAFSGCEESIPAGMPEDTLRREALAAAGRLGVPRDSIVIKEYPVRRFSEHRQDILEELVGIRKEFAPDIVVVPSSADVHQDHTVIHQEAVRAFKARTILGYELPWNCIAFSSSLIVRLSREQLEMKKDAIGEYKSQSVRPYMSPDYFEQLARLRGVQIGVDYGEAYELVRWAWL